MSRPRPRLFSGPPHLGKVLGLLEIGTDSGGPDHLVPAGLAGPAAVGVFPAEDTGFLVTERAGTGDRFQEVERGMDCFTE